MRDPVTAYIGLGANLGDAVAAVQAALAALDALPGTRVVARSGLYRSAPHEASGPDFINAVAAVTTELTAPHLLRALLALEAAAGRQRPHVNAPRTLDLDLLRFGDARIDSPELKVPHPRMQSRAFVLVPLAEIAPSLVSAASLDRVAGQRVRKL
jgi:2-amino-4-hydroxy-6-hydroxymethyldihydropteridine diphosphokinase